MNFDMNRTWTMALALLSANAQLLSIIAGVFLLLPGMLFYMALPAEFTTMTGTTTPDPEQLLAMLQAAAGQLAIAGLVMIVAQAIGYLAMIALMGDDRPTVGEAIKRALSLLPSAIGVALLLALAYVVVGMGAALVLGLIIAAIIAVAGQAIGVLLSALSVLVMLLAILFFATRVILTNPILALEGVTNPVTVIKRSWTLTKSHSLKIFVFFVLIMAAYFVISIIIGAVFGVIAGLLGNGTASIVVLALSNGLIGAAVAMLFSAILVAMHRQLAGLSPTSIDQTFG